MTWNGSSQPPDRQLNHPNDQSVPSTHTHTHIQTFQWHLSLEHSYFFAIILPNILTMLLGSKLFWPCPLQPSRHVVFPPSRPDCLANLPPPTPVDTTTPCQTTTPVVCCGPMTRVGNMAQTAPKSHWRMSFVIFILFFELLHWCNVSMKPTLCKQIGQFDR